MHNFFEHVYETEIVKAQTKKRTSCSDTFSFHLQHTISSRSGHFSCLFICTPFTLWFFITVLLVWNMCRLNLWLTGVGGSWWGWWRRTLTCGCEERSACPGRQGGTLWNNTHTHLCQHHHNGFFYLYSNMLWNNTHTSTIYTCCLQGDTLWNNTCPACFLEHYTHPLRTNNWPTLGQIEVLSLFGV